MHYYKKNIGDYYKKAGRLTMLQHGAYNLLIDSIYDREIFPTKEEAINWCWASSKEEVEAVKFILKKFFTQGGGIYKQKRVQEELNTFRTRSEINTRIAIDRETNRAKKATKRVPIVHESPPNQEPLTIKPIKETTAGVETLSSSPPRKRDACPYQKIIALYHEKLPMCPQVAKLTDGRKRAINARWKNGMNGIDNWELYFNDVAKSKFLTGKVDPKPGFKQFVADIDFLIRESTIVKMQEGKYHG